MSAQTPQVLSRGINGGSAATGRAGEHAKGKGPGESNAARAARGRAQSSKDSETAKKAGETETAKPAKTKPQNEGCKLIVRRLPPGMVEAEFTSILGQPWETGNGKVDWFFFAPGKVSMDPSKPSRPGRAYLHLIKKDYIMALDEAVRAATWEDAKSTFSSPCLVGPPSLEFSVYKKVPGNKKRADARQGTIDQDPEFMAFLEELANPAPARETIDVDEADEATETKVTTTPLVEYLKEKKANKGKESANKKRSERGKGAAKDEDSTKKKAKESKTDKNDKPAKESVKILTKKPAVEQAVDATKKTAKEAGTAPSQDAPKSRRAGIAAAARILQRDLGLSPGTAHRRARQDAAKVEGTVKIMEKKDTETANSETPGQETAPAAESASTNARPTPSSTKAQPASKKPRGGRTADKAKVESATTTPTVSNPPVILKKKPDSEANKTTPDTPTTQKSAQSSSAKPASVSQNTTKAAATKVQAPPKKAPSVTPDATRAFVKNANASQGITEAAVREALASFGVVTAVEMDKRKGFAFVDFADHSGLVNAINASPLAVAQGTVQILERRDKKPATTTAGSASGSPTVSTAPASEKDKGSVRGRRGRGGKASAGVSGQATTAPSSTAG